MKPVFISHASNDAAVARGLCQHLEERGLSCWLAPRDIRPSQDWSHAIDTAIKDASVLVLVFSDTSNKSGRILAQVELASEQHIPLLWFRIEEIQPVSDLAAYADASHLVNAVTPPYEAYYAELCDAVLALQARNS